MPYAPLRFWQAEGLDILSGGMPCHPFSDMRCRTTFKSKQTGKVEDHDEYDIVMRGVNKLVLKRRPCSQKLKT